MRSRFTPLAHRRAHVLGAAAAVLAAAGMPAGAAAAQARPRLIPLSAAAVVRGAAASESASPGHVPVARATASTQPLTPRQIRSAYALPASGARGQRIAIISAYDDPHAQADLNAYTAEYGIPRCTGANRCFEKLNEAGKASPLPPTDVTGGTWITESAIGIEIARGVCESCSIMLVEANTPGRGDLSAAVNAAANAGATVIVTTFTLTEDPFFDPGYVLDYSHARAPVVSAVGDAQSGPYGYSGEANFPSSLPDVIAVGGTQLRLGRGGTYGGEQAWSGTVSGCSLYQPAPLWQAGDAAAVGCQDRRAVADLAAVAEPGAAVHITGTGVPGGPWYASTGTSLSAPIIAAAIGLAGSLGSREAQTLYARARSDPGAFHDIRTGVNAPLCRKLICRAARGYDGPTGLGTPDGLAAFLPSGGALSRHRPRILASSPGSPLHVGGSWRARLKLSNENPFAVTGTIVVRRTLRVGGRLRPIIFTTRKIALGPLASATESISIAARYRSLLGRLKTVDAYMVVRVKGPAGRYASATRKLVLDAP